MRFRGRARGFCVALGLGLAPLARADTLLTQEVDSAGGHGQMTVRFHHGKIRTDLAEPVSTLFDPATGETIYLQHHRQTFSRLTKEQNLEVLRKIKGATPPGTVGKLEATTQKQEISGHPAELYHWTIGGLKLRFWIARDYPNAAALNALLDQLQNSGPAQATAALLPSRTVLPGVRLRTEMETDGNRVTYTIVSVAEVPDDEAPFRLPAGYKEVPFEVSPAPPAP